MTFELAAIARSSLMLAIGLAIASALRRQPAAFRHTILATAIVLAALQPVGNVVMPSWAVPAFWTTAAPIAAVSPDASQVGTTTSFEIIAPQREERSAPLPTSILLAIWIAGVVISLGGMALAALWLMWLGHRGVNAGGAWLPVAGELTQALGITQRVRLRITPHDAVLATWGAWRPVILLPRGAAEWPVERIRVVLAHELAHIARRDWLVHLVAECARAVYWFNPLFWLACARLRRDGEHACDDVVLEHGISNTSYASHLVDLARAFRVHGRTWLPAPSMARPSTLERRIRVMLNPQSPSCRLSTASRGAIALLLVALALPIAAATAHAGSPGGVLRDPSGRVLPGATVRLSAIGSEAVHEAQTDSSGAFQFPEVADGDYMLLVNVPGFQSVRQRLRVSSSMTPLNVIMQVGTLTETISIRAGDVVRPMSTKPALPMPEPPPCGNTEVGGNLKPPRKLKDVRPDYKQALIDNKVEGNILMQATIGVDGRVRNVEVVSPVNADLEEAAVAAVSQWEFSPTYLNCQAVEVRMFVTARFSLEQ